MRSVILTNPDDGILMVTVDNNYHLNLDRLDIRPAGNLTFPHSLFGRGGSYVLLTTEELVHLFLQWLALIGDSVNVEMHTTTIQAHVVISESP